MEELYLQKDILPDDEYVRGIIVEKYEELLNENDMLRKEVQELKYQLKTRKKAKKSNKLNSVDSENETYQLSFDFGEISGNVKAGA